MPPPAHSGTCPDHTSQITSPSTTAVPYAPIAPPAAAAGEVSVGMTDSSTEQTVIWMATTSHGIVRSSGTSAVTMTYTATIGSSAQAAATSVTDGSVK